MSESPRFTGPDRVRQRIRLAAALGMLAAIALTIGGFASLAGSRPVLPRHGADAPSPTHPTTDPRELLAPAARLELDVREAEAAVARARAGISKARQRDTVDPSVLEALERRLEHLGESPLDSVRRNYGPPPEPVDSQDRPHVHAIASGPREL
jgi:hypothetical protein